MLTKSLSPSVNPTSPSDHQQMNWAEHIKRCKQSDLSVKAYCRANELTYDTFLYHYRKAYPALKKAKLIPVTLTGPDAKRTDHVLCRLELREGHSLSIHDEQALSVLLATLL